MTITASTLLTNSPTSDQLIKVALIDLYNGEANLGIQAIQDLVAHWSRQSDNISLALDVFETRKTGDVPDFNYDFFISSGGPGSPFAGKGSAWEANYFKWVDKVRRHNQSRAVQEGARSARHVLFICHSFQMMCRHFNLADVVARKSQSFGVFKTHQTPNGLVDPLFNGLYDPFYVADFRDWQVIQPNTKQIEALGATILAREKKRPHVPLEQAIMGLRISKEMVGVQFHPEADPAGMLKHFQCDKRRDEVIRVHGETKFNQIISRLKDPGYLLHTHQTIIPNFLHSATADLLSTSSSI